MGRSIDDDDLVAVSVPRRHVAAVYEALAVAQACSGASPAVPDWTRDDVTRLKGTLKNATVRRLLDLTAQRAGEWVTFHELWEVMGRTQQQVAADLGGFTALIRRRLGKATGRWPLEVDWGSSGGPRRGVKTRYRMLPEVARWWWES